MLLNAVSKAWLVSSSSSGAAILCTSCKRSFSPEWPIETLNLKHYRTRHAFRTYVQIKPVLLVAEAMQKVWHASKEIW